MKNAEASWSASDLKSLIEKMSNGYEVAYLGLGISTVTSEIEKEYISNVNRAGTLACPYIYFFLLFIA